MRLLRSGRSVGPATAMWVRTGRQYEASGLAFAIMCRLVRCGHSFKPQLRLPDEVTPRELAIQRHQRPRDIVRPALVDTDVEELPEIVDVTVSEGGAGHAAGAIILPGQCL